MTSYDYLKFLGALIFVLGMMGGLMLVLKRMGLGGASMLPANKRRLKVIEVLPIDARHKAVLLKRDDMEHLVLLGGTSDTVIETNIKGPAGHDDTQP